jgi:antitoxin component YwqK of YwqJK toxin-antitoxin module
MLKFDKKEGFFKNFHENGQLKKEGNFINGKKEGLYKTYYENGQLEFEGNYKEGELKSEGNFKDDKDDE